ncbi:hypothetical protein LTR08_003562 [Meristemomyces frigidus]|nr:hypothetical protein LTR08_003562 [Meristemomyces frigidus]
MAASSRYPQPTTPPLGQGQQLQPRTPVSPSSTFAVSPYRQPSHRHDAYDLNSQLVSPIMSRSPSIAGSDRYSIVSGLTSNTYLPGNPQNVNPPPSYVAPFGAAQVVSEHRTPGRRRASSDEEDGQASKSRNEVRFSSPALELVNNFLDQLLFSILSAARSTNLHALRPAVTEVLKARLARDAIASAEEELQELLAGGEEEEEDNTKQNAAEGNRSWDLELVWKRTRLRVMVYMRLGEMEDEDEERYIKEEELFHGTERRFSQTSGLVSWAAAIFLTGVLEYVAEQTLQVAGTPSLEEEKQKPVAVDDYDVEKVALNSTLGRLWRTWRKSLRTTAAAPSTDTHRFSRLSNENFYSTMGRGMVGDAPSPRMMLDEVPEMQHPEHVLASNIPLPMGDRQRDVDEIEVPGLARDPEANGATENSKPATARRNSFTHSLARTTIGGLPTPASSSPAERMVSSKRPGFNRQRSMSVPTPARTPVTSEDLRRLHTPGAYPETPAVERMQPFEEEGKEEYIPGAFLETPAVEKDQPLEEARQDEHMSGLSSDVPAVEKDQAVEEARQEEHTPGISSDTSAADKDQPLEEDRQEEQKASAQEMAPHRRASQDVKDLLDKVVNREPAEDSAEQNEHSEHHGLIGGALAGASAAAAGIAALVYGSKAEHEASLEGDNSVGDGRNIEELDKRKSMLDMKALIGSGQVIGEHETPEILHIRHVSLSQPETPPTMVRTGSNHSRKSVELKDPYRLGNVSGQELSQRSSMTRQQISDEGSEVPTVEDNGIGVARTSDVRVASPVPTMTPSPDEQDARESGRRPSRLVLGATSQRGNTTYSPTFQKPDSPKASPQGFLASRSLSSTTERPEFSDQIRQRSTDEQMRVVPIKVATKRRSIPGVAFTSAALTPTVEQNAHRQSWSAAVQHQREQQQDGGAARPFSVPAVPSVPAVHQQSAAPEMLVQDSSAVQQMASARHDEMKYERGPADAPVLTSASIRGPEDFDMFAQEGDTLKYARTPEPERDGPDGQLRSSRFPNREQVAELSSAPSVSRGRSAGPPLETGDTRKGRSSVRKQATSAVPDDITEREREEENDRKRESRRSISRPPPRNTSTHRRSGLIAREPQVQTESTRDFADWIRSTGPNKDQEVLPVLNPANRSTTSLHSLRSAHINGAASPRPSRSSSLVSQEPRERTKSLTQSVMIKNNIPPVPAVPAVSSKNRRSMRARTPTGEGDGNSELIDFIRSGPEQNGEHRISRSVAPFRSTMDSDQLKDMGDRINGNKPLDLRLNTSVGAAPSLPSARSQSSLKAPSSNRNSTNTRAGALLANNANTTNHPAHSGQRQRLPEHAVGGKSALSTTEAGPTPVRKRHRNKDPYSIDPDEDDQDDLLTALPKGKHREESIADFLNNNEPPKDNAPRPLVNRASVQPKSVLNKSRANSISSQRSANPNAVEAATGARTRSMQSPSGARPGSSGARSVQSTASGPRAPGNRPYSQVSAGAPPIPVANRPKMEPRTPGASTKPTQNGVPNREPSTKKNSTKDLVEFFKNSGPDDDDKSAPAPIVGRQSKLNPKDAEKARKKAEKDSLKNQTEKKLSFFQRLMGRKKTWLDMP